jgi:hypothetical protein
LISFLKQCLNCLRNKEFERNALLRQNPCLSLTRASGKLPHFTLREDCLVLFQQFHRQPEEVGRFGRRAGARASTIDSIDLALGLIVRRVMVVKEHSHRLANSLPFFPFLPRWSLDCFFVAFMRNGESSFESRGQSVGGIVGMISEHRARLGQIERGVN